MRLWVLCGAALAALMSVIPVAQAQRRGGDAPKQAGQPAKVFYKQDFNAEGNVDNFEGPVAWTDEPGGALGSAGSMKITAPGGAGTAERYVKWADEDATMVFMAYPHGITSAYFQAHGAKAGKNLHAYFRVDQPDQWTMVVLKANSLVGFGGGASSPGEAFRNFMFVIEGADKNVEEPYLLIDEVVVYSGEDGQPPAAPPAELAANFYAEKKIASLNWKPAKDDVGVYKYEVHRSDKENFTPAKETQLAIVADTYYEDPKCEPNKTYYYKVVGKDMGGFKAASAEVKYVAPAETVVGGVDGTAGKKKGAEF